MSDLLRKVMLSEFTSDKEFDLLLDNLLEETRQIIKLEIQLYGDGFVSRGLPNLAVGIDRKSTRIYKRVIQDSTGRDSFDHDLGDLIRYSIYTQLFYRMLVMKGKLSIPVEDDRLLEKVYADSPNLDIWRK